MNRDELHAELERLRAEVATLSAERRETAAVASAETVNDEDNSTDAHEAADMAKQNQVQELISLLEKEVRDSPAITCLAVFALGVLMGRLLR